MMNLKREGSFSNAPMMMAGGVKKLNNSGISSAVCLIRCGNGAEVALVLVAPSMPLRNESIEASFSVCVFAVESPELTLGVCVCWLLLPGKIFQD